ncbi:MAG: universal stress protein, partial [Rhodospirillales bacterium]|nr:universal stress protein [Rhodospirillales bacterium]
MIKDILLHLEHDPAHDAGRDYAISVAEAFEAHLAGVAFGSYASLPSVTLPGFPPDVLADILAQEEAAARDAIKHFEEAARRSGLSAASRLILQSEISPQTAFSSMGRRFDLSVIMQSDPEKGASNELLIEGALFESGRPIIVVPYIQKAGLTLDHVTCCWDGSQTAARAVNDALPLLKRARKVELFIVANEKTKYEQEIRGADIAKHLARHDVNVEVESLPAADIDVGNAILSHAADRSASLIVMGGYGHSRFREFVLGGATREILTSMTVP